MGFRINTNTNSAYAGNQLQKSHQALAQSLKRLSTGKRINAASDDAAGMVIANRLSSQARGMGQSIRNANDAISITQMADSAYGQATDLVQDIRVKAIQAAGPAQSAASLKAIQADIATSLESLRDLSQNTAFNGENLLSGNYTGKEFQVGASGNQTVDISLGSLDPAQISDAAAGTLADIDVTTPESAQDAVAVADAALDYISEQRAAVGSTQNQLESTINNLSSSRINTLSAESEIRDLDYAEESATLNKIKLLAKARAFAQSQASKTAQQIIDIFE